MAEPNLIQALGEFQQDCTDFWLPVSGNIERIHDPISPNAFYRRFVSKSVPCILANGIMDSWPASALWKHQEYFIETLENTNISVDCTPHGYGDHLLDLSDDLSSELFSSQTSKKAFAKPCSMQMIVQEFFHSLEQQRGSGIHGVDRVVYLSSQNDNLRNELAILAKDLPEDFTFGDEIFGARPEAINLWIGNEHSVSSTHKDHYENMYGVISGEKTFILYPPSSAPFIREDEAPTCQYVYGGKNDSNSVHYTGKWSLQVEIDKKINGLQRTSWIDESSIKALPNVKCTVLPGEMLYLPALWYHRVSQTKQTIAVNYWYDMEFDCKYAYYNLARSLAF